MCCDRTMTVPSHLPEILRAVAERLAAEAAAYVAERRVEVFGADWADAGAVASKSTPTDPVTVVDTETEALLRRRLAELRPGDPVLGEEGGGPTDSRSPRRRRHLGARPDRRDGQLRLRHTRLTRCRWPRRWAVCRWPVRSPTSARARCIRPALGLGAHVQVPADRRRLRCTDVSELSMALLGTGFGYSPARRAAQAALLAGLLPVVRDVRRIGSAALDLCMVAARAGSTRTTSTGSTCGTGLPVH